MTYVAQADAGGPIDATKRLPIEDVLDAKGFASGNSEESLKRILSAVPIQTEETLKYGSNAQENVGTNHSEIESIYNTYFSTLEATNSKRLNISSEALSSGEKLNNITSDMDTLQKAIDEYLSQDIMGKVEEYNQKLSKLKKGAKLKLLRMKADEINAAAKRGNSDYCYRRNVPYRSRENVAKPNDYEVDGNTWRHYNNLTQHSYADVSNLGGSSTYYTGTYTDFKYLNYWRNANSVDFWPFNATDDDVANLENRFVTNDIPLPYDPGAVVEVDVERM